MAIISPTDFSGQQKVVDNLRIFVEAAKYRGEPLDHTLLKLPDEAECLRVIGLIAQGEWTVAKTEQYIDSLLAPRTPQRRELGGFVLRDVRLFLNSIDHQLDLVRAAGVGASRERQETEQEIVLTIRIPKSKASLSRSR